MQDEDGGDEDEDGVRGDQDGDLRTKMVFFEDEDGVIKTNQIFGYWYVSRLE